MSETPDLQDTSARKRLILGSAWFTVPGTLAIISLGYALSPPRADVGDVASRLAFTLRWLVVAFLPYAAVCLHILYARFAEGAHNPLLGSESEGLQVHCRVMQNTLEQLVWFALCSLALATYLPSAQMRLLPVISLLFAVARVVYWWGYLRRRTLGRSPGVQMTFTINILLLALVLWHFAKFVFS